MDRDRFEGHRKRGKAEERETKSILEAARSFSAFVPSPPASVGPSERALFLFWLTSIPCIYSRYSHGPMFAATATMPAPSEAPAKKRRPQVKLACMNCRRQHAGCTDSRPCERCTRLGLASSCEDIPRRKRSRKKHLTEFDDDEDFESLSEAAQGT